MVAQSSEMPVPTEPRQPVVYDMMLFAHALLKLHENEGAQIGRQHANFCDKQTYFENALTKIRALSQFLGDPQPGLISIESPEFGGVADKRFIATHFDTISKYLSHLHEQRYKKEAKYPRPTAADALAAGQQILDFLKPLLDRVKHELVGDAARWYKVFEARYQQLVSLR